MKRVGVYMALFGIAAIILPYFERQLMILAWIDNWGETVSWIIKIGLVVGGAIIFFTTGAKPKHSEIDLSNEESKE